MKVVVQALEQRLPVMLASELDQILDSRSERFRRDAILMFLMGIIVIITAMMRSGPYGPDKLLLSFSVPIFLYAVWDYLAYKRSLAPNFDWGVEAEPAVLTSTGEASNILTLGINTAEMTSGRETVETAKMLPEAARRGAASVTETTTRRLDAQSPESGSRK
ncbi:MAG: hypothetical protein M3X11_06385 [Acidobacteriota bacterium]|nr:hypothetical protein [Acidobacteriota bacterium]